MPNFDFGYPPPDRARDARRRAWERWYVSQGMSVHRAWTFSRRKADRGIEPPEQ